MLDGCVVQEQGARSCEEGHFYWFEDILVTDNVWDLTEVLGMVVDDAGDVYVVSQINRFEDDGYGYGVTASRAALTKLGADGEVLWAQDLSQLDVEDPGTSAANIHVPIGIARDLEGALYVTGMTLGGTQVTPNQGAVIGKFDAAGTMLWTRTFGNADTYDFPSRPRVHPENGVVLLVGSSMHDGPSDVNNVLALDTDGDVRWVHQLGESFSTPRVEVTTGGRVVVVRTVEAPTSSELFDVLDAYDEDGQEEGLFAPFDDFPDQRVASILAGEGDTIYALSYESNALDGKVTVGRLNVDLELDWKRSLGTNRDDHLAEMTLDRDGNLYVAGSTEGRFATQPWFGGQDNFVAKFSPAGIQQWTRTFGSERDDWVSAIAMDQGPGFYVADRWSIDRVCPP